MADRDEFIKSLGAALEERARFLFEPEGPDFTVQGTAITAEFADAEGYLTHAITADLSAITTTRKEN